MRRSLQRRTTCVRFRSPLLRRHADFDSTGEPRNPRRNIGHCDVGSWLRLGGDRGTLATKPTTPHSPRRVCTSLFLRRPTARRRSSYRETAGRYVSYLTIRLRNGFEELQVYRLTIKVRVRAVSILYQVLASMTADVERVCVAPRRQRALILCHDVDVRDKCSVQRSSSRGGVWVRRGLRAVSGCPLPVERLVRASGTAKPNTEYPR